MSLPVVQGGVEEVLARVRGHLDAGPDDVLLQVLGSRTSPEGPDGLELAQARLGTGRSAASRRVAHGQPPRSWRRSVMTQGQATSTASWMRWRGSGPAGSIAESHFASTFPKRHQAAATIQVTRKTPTMTNPAVLMLNPAKK